MDTDGYLNQFFVTFSLEAALSIPDDEFSKITINNLIATEEIYVRTPQVSEIKEIQFINLFGSGNLELG